jgi:hypothetical protein
MVSKFKLFAILVFALLLGSLSANATPSTDSNGTPSVDDVCILPPPSALMVPEIGTSWYTASWTPVSGAFQYQIITRDASNGAVLNTTFVPATFNSATISGLIPGTVVIPEVRSVCYNYELSPPRIGPNTGIIVIDVVGSTYKPASNYQGAGCDNMGSTLTTGCNINVNDGVGEFEIYHVNGANAYFKSFKSPAGHISIMPEEDTSPYTFDFPGNGYYVDIKVGTDVIARITTGSTANSRTIYRCNSAICGNENHISYTIRKIAATGLSQNALDSRSDESLDSQRLSATPNPFADLLEIQVPFATPENELHMALYDLQGRMMITQNIANGGPIQTIETGTLPTGVYILRVECGGKAETIKVVKTQ